MDLVPTYTLYGENVDDIGAQWLHCESIAARSARFNWEIQPHRHTRFFQLLYVDGGSAEALIQGRNVAPAPPFALTMPPQAVHGFRFSQDIEGHVVTLTIDRVERMLEDCPEAFALLSQPHTLSLANDAPAASAISEHVTIVAREFAGSAAWRSPLIEAHLTIVLIELSRLLSRAVAERDENFSPLHRHALQFRVLVDRHYRQQQSVAFYAGRLGMSQTHLNRICRAAFRASALGIIHRRVVLEATRDLTFTVMSVKEIAGSLGFDDPAYFTRFFTQRVGVSPKRFRERQVG
jgi:AraC family transcriptional regulator, transcriptional activator of pobA